MTEPVNVLEAMDVKKFYYRAEKQVARDGRVRRRTTIESVGGVSLSIQRGEILGILGETGCGKSTLGRVLIGLEAPTSGSIALNGEPIGAIAKRGRELRRRAQMIFQNPFDVFDSRHKIEKILTRALDLHNIGGSAGERLDLVRTTLERYGLSPGADFGRRYPGELSGGQLQRISIIRSILLKPDFVVADEPVSMLDVSVRADIINMIRKLTNESRMAVAFISHDIATTKYIADRIAVMYLGQIVETGRTADVIENPRHPYTKALISNCPSADPCVAFTPIKLAGDPPSPAKLPPGCYFSPRCAENRPDCFKEDQQLIKLEDKRLVRCRYADQAR